MSYSIVPRVVLGDLWTAAQHNTYIKDNFAAGVPDIFTAAGDLAYATAADVAAALAVGSNGSRLYTNSAANAPVWAAQDTHLCLVSRNADQAMVVSPTNVLFNAEIYDTDAYHDTVTNSDRITIPANLDGTYFLFAIIPWASPLGNLNTVALKKNGSTYLAEVSEESLVDATGVECRWISCLADLVATDYVVVECSWGGSAPTIKTADLMPYFGAIRMV